MTLGQGSLKRSPWWCWAVMLAATLTLLPGAAFVANAKDKTKTISFASNGVRNLMQRLDKLEWTFGLPAGRSIQESSNRYQVRATVFRPLVTKCGQDLVPTDAEVLRALEEQQTMEQGGSASLHETHIENVRIVKEKIADLLEPPRKLRFVGSVQAHHGHFKCTVYFTKAKRVAWPIPHASSEHAVEVLHLDVVHDHRLEDSPPPSARDTPEKSNSTGRQ